MKFNISKKWPKGFTIAEIVVIISVIAILATIGIVSFFSIQQKARDNQRTSQATLIAEALEKYYDKNGEYPNCETLKDVGAEITEASIQSVLDIPNTEILITPKSTEKTVTKTFKCSEDATLSGDNKPSSFNDVFTYHLDSSGGWKIEYFNEIENTDTVAVSNRRGEVSIVEPDPVIGAITLANPSLNDPVLGKNDGSVTLIWGTVANNNGYTISYTADGGPATTTTIGKDSTSKQYSGLTTGKIYSFSIKTNGDGVSYNGSGYSDVKTIKFYSVTISAGYGGSVTDSGTNYFKADTTIKFNATTTSSYYYLSKWTTIDPTNNPQCDITNMAYNNSLSLEIKNIASDKNCKISFKPGPPTVNAPTTSGVTSTWTWTLSFCPVGSTVKGQWKFITFNNDPSDTLHFHTLISESEWFDLTGLSKIDQNTKFGLVGYDLYITNKCVNNADNSQETDYSDPEYSSYERPKYELELTDPGNVGSTLTGAGMYNVADIVPISATIPIGYTFHWWMDGCNDPNASTSITMPALDRSCSANFNKATTNYNLSTWVWPDGSGIVSPSSGSYAKNTNVDISATPAIGYEFSNWGDCSTSRNKNISISMDNNKNCNAYFSPTGGELTFYNLTLAISPSGGGTITADGSGSSSINKSDGGSYSFEDGAKFNITATANSGYTFSGWSGCATGVGSLALTMNQDESCTANFALNGGPVLVAPPQPTVSYLIDETTGYKIAFRWSTTCSYGTPVYFYRIYNNDSLTPWAYSTTFTTVGTAAIGTDYVALYEGVTGSADVKAQCTDGSSYSGDSDPGSISYLRPVAEPESPAFGISRKIKTYKADGITPLTYYNNAVTFTVLSNCGALTATMLRYDLFIGSSLYKFNDDRTLPTPGWYSQSATDNNGWIENSYIEMGWLYNTVDLLPYDATYAKIPAGKTFGIAVDYYCENPRTGVSSVYRTGRVSSGELAVPATQEYF